MRYVKHRATSINDLPLWRAARERQLRELPYAARRVSDRFRLEPATARLIAELAGLNGGRD